MEPILEQRPTPAQTKNFMVLPTELRFLVYQHLIPNTPSTIPATKDKEWPHLRQDNERCSPALLLANRQIHHELIPLFYAIPSFEIRFNFWHIRLLGMEFLIRSLKFPMNFQYMTQMSLHLRLEKSTKESKFWNPGVEAIVNHIISLPERKLKRLDFTVIMTPAFFYHLDLPDEECNFYCDESLKFDFWAVRELKGVSVGQVTMDMSEEDVYDIFGGDSNYKKSVTKMERIFCVFFEALDREMGGNSGGCVEVGVVHFDNGGRMV
jgi:hypothetical protein